MNTDYLRIGVVLRPQGVRGELKVMPLTDDASRFCGLDEIFIEGKGGGYASRSVLSASVRDDAVYLTIDGIDDRDKAETLRNAYICVDRAHAVKLPQGRYFVCDLIGCGVYDTDGEYLGTLNDVFETGANDVYAISKKGEKGFLVPALKKLMVSVDVTEKRIVFDSKVLGEVAVYDD